MRTIRIQIGKIIECRNMQEKLENVICIIFGRKIRCSYLKNSWKHVVSLTIGNPAQKNKMQSPTNIQVWYFFSEGFSSIIKAKKVCIPPQIEDRAKLISIKKNKNDHNGDTSISNTADG